MTSAPSTVAVALPPAGAAAPRWCRATRLLVAAATGWLLFTVAHLAFTGRWWLWLLPDLLPPLAFLLVPALLLVTVPLVGRLSRPLPYRPRAVVLVAASAALLLGVPDAGLNPYAFAGREPVPAGALRVFVWNTEYWDQAEDPETFLDFLRAQRADLYLLQEHLHWDTAAGLTGARSVTDLDRLHRAFPGYAVAARGELLTLSRYPIVGQPPVGPDAELRTDAGFDRVFTAAKVLRTDLAVGGRVLSAYNVHLPVQVNLELTADFLDFVADRDVARRAQLRGLDRDLAANRNPVLVAGDFNTSPAMGDLRDLRARLRDAAAAGRDTYPVSWPADGPVTGWRLDWAFSSAGAVAHRYRLVDPAGLSDHRAQELLITLKEER